MSYTTEKVIEKEYESDEYPGRYCENCHIATGLCDCKDCDICEEARV